MSVPFEQVDKAAEPLTMDKLRKLFKEMGSCKMTDEGSLLFVPASKESYEELCKEFGVDPYPLRTIDVWKLMEERKSNDT